MHPRRQTACDTYSPRRSGTRRAACPAGCRLNLPHHEFLAPIPPTRARRALFPAGRGSPKVYFAGGFAPGTPALNRLRHVQTVPNRYPETEPGRRHSQGTASCRFAANRGFNPGDARGEAPCMRKLKSSPFPGGEGGWGDRGQEIKLKAGAADNPNRRAPPPGNVNAHRSQQEKKQAPLESRNGGGQPVPRPVQPRGCKGRSPLHKKTKNLPLPRRGRALCERG